MIFEIRLINSFSGRLPLLRPSFSEAVTVTLAIGMKKPIKMLTMALTIKLMIKPGNVKCPDVKVPVSERKKLMTSPILMPMPRLIFFMFSSILYLRINPVGFDAILLVTISL